MTYIVTPKHMPTSFNILVVGCGGTGGFVAEGLCRLLANSKIPIILIDHDRVEPHNLIRQNFFHGDVGKFKAQALAERLARQFGREVGYCIFPFSHDLVDASYGAGLVHRLSQGIIIGCVDNADARRAIATRFPFSSWWIDAGNGYSSGQVLIGNTNDLESIWKSFNETTHEVDRLPLPTRQVPSLLAPLATPTHRQRDCAQAVAAEEQSPVINQTMAMLVLEFVSRLLSHKLSWMGAYIDLEAGTLQTVPVAPETVARMLRDEGRRPNI